MTKNRLFITMFSAKSYMYESPQATSKKEPFLGNILTDEEKYVFTTMFSAKSDTIRMTLPS